MTSKCPRRLASEMRSFLTILQLVMQLIWSCMHNFDARKSADTVPFQETGNHWPLLPESTTTIHWNPSTISQFG